MKDKKVENSRSNTKVSVKDLDLKTPIHNLFKGMGKDPDSSELKDTPKRFEQAIKYILSGYDRSFEDEVTSFDNSAQYKDIISLKNIDFFSLCEHHLLPFFGYAHIAYVPSKEGYLGISKLARVVDIYAKRLQTQEVLSSQIADALIKHGKVKGVAILIESRHLCAVARGVEKKATLMSTCAYYGAFETDKSLQQHFLELVRDREKI